LLFFFENVLALFPSLILFIIYKKIVIGYEYLFGISFGTTLNHKLICADIIFYVVNICLHLSIGSLLPPALILCVPS
jgi:hypothetical protein